MWFFYHKDLLTKYNSSKRSWDGSKVCCFCHKEETIQHLFFDCSFARVIWRIIHMTFSLAPPKNVTNLFGNWLRVFRKKKSCKQEWEFCAIVWAMWNLRNDFICNKRKTPIFYGLFLWLSIRSVRGPISNQWRIDRTWILGVIDWRR
jgi:hypothetical protein